DTEQGRVRAVEQSRKLATVAGSGAAGTAGDGELAAVATFDSPAGVTVAPNGRIYVADRGNSRIREIRSIAGTGTDEIAVVSRDGGEVYVFSSRGRHLRTLDGLTGRVTWTFSYDAENRLTGVTDGAGNATAIARDAGGVPTAIVSPNGHRTALAVDARGRLASVTDEAGGVSAMTYDSGDLLASFTTPRGFTSTYQYDELGLLVYAEGAAGGGKRLARALIAATNDHEVSLTTAEGLTTTYRSEKLGNEHSVSVVTDPAGLVTRTETYRSGRTEVTAPSGRAVTTEIAADPRWGTEAAYTSRIAARMPGGRERVATIDRQATLADPGGPLSATELRQAATIGGRTWQAVYDAAARRWTLTSPLGRTATVTLDGEDRIVESSRAGMLPASFTWDTQGRLTGVSQGTRTTTVAYDLRWNVASVTGPAREGHGVCLRPRRQDARGYGSRWRRDRARVGCRRERDRGDAAGPGGAPLHLHAGGPGGVVRPAGAGCDHRTRP
ncbi:MAG: hypothetical protein HYV63_25445, partial [Candidatus Schekmanbacteria bacterium]|nr:hypothetical protein [Candidatus Schekmanbacteria bacterium]